MRRLWLTGLINEVHVASRQTYGSRRIHAELTIGMKVQVRKAPGGRPDEQSRHPRPSRASESETTPWHRHRRRSRAPQIPPALTERTMDYGYYGTSHERSKNLLLRRDGHLLQKDRWLVDRQRPRLSPRRQRARHGDQKSAATGRWNRSRRPRSSIHLVGFHQQDPLVWTDALVRHDRRLL